MGWENRSKSDLVLVGIALFIPLVIIISVYTAFHSAANLPIEKGLIGRWVFHSNLGSKIGDKSGQGHNGIIKNPSWIRGRGYLALKLDGESTYVEVPYEPGLSWQKGFTLTAWINPESHRQRMVLFQKTPSKEQDYPPITFYAPWGAGRLGLVLSDGNRRVGFLSDESIRGGKWQHVAVTFDSDTGEIKFFIDGQLAGNRKTTVKPSTGSGKLFIGAGLFSGQKDFYFQGQLDSISLYKRVLTPPEIGDLSSPE